MMTLKSLSLSLCASLLLGCQSALDKEGYAYDPFEPTNRAIFAFNQQLDNIVLQPIATGYQTIMPDVAQTGVRNVVSNLDDVSSLANSLLQGKFHQSLRIATRIVSNSVFGLGGLIDVASHMNNPKIKTDFGATLAHYGVESGAFIMIPILGPSTLRDGFGNGVDALTTSPLAYSSDVGMRVGVTAAGKIQQRADLLGKESLLETSPDPYATMRDVWLQHRFGQLGFVVEEPEFDDEPTQSALPTTGHEP
ncbi:MAG: VacJ family lipoprotein [Cardiobacteriaceae bacterium]|nr:VacJ family lipoprotein [Cardiobacteriaceae bacterium]